jgi:hypothetical protein
MNTAFSHVLRVVVCPACGEAVHGSPAGGRVRCPLCEEEVEVTARDEQPLPAGLTRGSESERIERLQAQDRKSVELPQELAALTKDGSLVPERLAEALAAWQTLRAALSVGEGAVEDAFYSLTLLLHRHMSGQDDDLQLRAVLETALDVLARPSYRQVLRCSLVLEAARVGDVTAAQDWLAPCDRYPYDLVADSAYRHAGAYLATLERQYARALEIIGPTGTPVLAERDVICTLLRANALERLGRIDDAVEELASGMQRMPNGVPAFDRVWRDHTELGLCRGSYRRARERCGHGSMPPPKPTRPPPRPSRTFRHALPWILLSLACLAAAVIIDAEVMFAGRQRLDMLFFVLALSLALPPILLFLRRARRR